MKLTDTLTGTKRDFTPLNKVVTMYVCGPNLYGPCHVGHALSFIVFDLYMLFISELCFNLAYYNKSIIVPPRSSRVPLTIFPFLFHS